MPYGSLNNGPKFSEPYTVKGTLTDMSKLRIFRLSCIIQVVQFNGQGERGRFATAEECQNIASFEHEISGQKLKNTSNFLKLEKARKEILP